MSELTLPKIICIIGPTASGKTAEAIRLAKEHASEVISVDSRQVYRTLDIGTEKITRAEMQGVPHHLIDIREPEERYSAGDFMHDATSVIAKLHAKNKTPILAGGTHFYFESLLYGLPNAPHNAELRTMFESIPTPKLLDQLTKRDSRRAREIDPHNRRRVLRALEIALLSERVPVRLPTPPRYDVSWVVVDLPPEQLRERIDARLANAFAHGLVDEVARTLARVGEARLMELGLEYKIVGEHLLGRRDYDSLIPALSAKLWQYARSQKRWIRRLTEGNLSSH